MEVTPDGKDVSASEEQPRNALEPMEVNPAGRDVSASAVQP